MYLVISENIPKQYIEKLHSLLPGSVYIQLSASNNTYFSIASHPDIFMCDIGNNTLIVAPSLPKPVIDHVRAAGRDVVYAEASPAGTYPGTAMLNAVRVGKHLIHNLQSTDGGIKRFADKAGLKFIDVAQGYARCSVIPITDTALITCDAGIAKETRKAGLDTLLISPGRIILPGEQYGFIGGASGILPDGRILFLGDITKHPVS